MPDNKIPNPQEIQREISSFLREKYGDRVVVPPQPEAEGATPGDKTKDEHPPQINFDLKPKELEEFLRKLNNRLEATGGDEEVEYLFKDLQSQTQPVSE